MNNATAQRNATLRNSVAVALPQRNATKTYGLLRCCATGCINRFAKHPMTD